MAEQNVTSEGDKGKAEPKVKAHDTVLEIHAALGYLAETISNRGLETSDKEAIGLGVILKDQARRLEVEVMSAPGFDRWADGKAAQGVGHE